MAYELPKLPYEYNALEPVIDQRTVEIHHDKHHQAYVNNVNAAIEKHPELANKPLEELLKNLKSVPEDIRMAVRNHGGGAVNHTLYWDSMGPKGGGEPEGALRTAIEAAYGSFAKFKEEFESAAKTQFGSGWAWLSVKPDGGVVVTKTANQDTPLSEGLTPIMVIDVWEHAYYLKYQNRRPDYVADWWKVVDWAKIAKRFEASSR